MRKILLPCAIAAVTLVAQFPTFAQPVETTGISTGRQTATTLELCAEVGDGMKG